MPIFTEEGGVIDVPTPEPGVIAGVGRATATWYAPDGTIWPLTSPQLGCFTLPGVAGIGAVPVELVADDNPRGGTIVRSVRRNERLVTWPLQIHGEDHMAFVTRWREYLDAITMTDELGAGVLEIKRPDGSARRIGAYYRDGFDNDKPYATDGVAALTLYCEDPFWYDPDPIMETRENAGAAPDFLDPFPSVASSQVLGATTIDNPGQAMAWPRWKVYGPASAITATLDETGESWTLTPANIGQTLIAGEWVEILTNPPRIRDNTGAIWAGALDWPGAKLFGIPRGTHGVTFSVSGADANTKITLEFNPRYKSA